MKSCYECANMKVKLPVYGPKGRFRWAMATARCKKGLIFKVGDGKEVLFHIGNEKKFTPDSYLKFKHALRCEHYLDDREDTNGESTV